ncbi:LuxR C-terminal-related transcriptional regulator [Clavibacter michiganensis]|uniref:LuxR family transcriptional regulator n=2 Tax=Clavibacter michiganensis subsp. insidiosus TaxID=33014 RepID=A0A0D5CGV9_9MICO|nr:LuxR C-terminal-related transcriptional regulator [Clavibacter michiganensis]AJW78497.1 LuxR family transcriptional regulator [Clavibacter michiganensis subsp. insidiosus]AWF98873.1 helix-turn-helix transcriptional regulator [Clavibacter michiganensis subsp. insidiosus]AWG00906.1 helix-turn-helix transcriptional regulator [Clavibacter michiganensis subsp. insidiosus]OQJ60509.1 helix-turn-helix transcriptional regulator [Clavibacter michiganensis subsp. insidiosus]RII88791.1 helix-turn-helix
MPSRTHPADPAAPPAADQVALLDGLHDALAAPLQEVAEALSGLLQPVVAHRALVIFTEDCTGRPRKKAGEAEVVENVTIAELDRILASLADGSGDVAGDAGSAWAVEHPVGGRPRTVAAWRADTGALLVLVDPVAAHDDVPGARELVRALWRSVAHGIRQQVAAAPPAYLAEARAVSSERARVVSELGDAHATTLESLLAVLRSSRTGDAAARQTAADLATNAMVELRAASDRDRSLGEEPVARAFARLRDDLRPLVRFRDLDVQFVEPPVDGRALPGEVAHAGRAIVRGAVLALVEQPDVTRVRIQWDCDGSNLLVGIRDDGAGATTADLDALRRLTDRVAALDGALDVTATPGWGSEIAVRLPLDAPAAGLDAAGEAGLSAREREVLALVAGGSRNRAIATALGISENTVKFHVANLLRKMGASTRAELAGLVRG